MNKLAIIVFLIPTVCFSQSYAPPAGQQGTTAIDKDSPLFTSWATGISVERGFVNIEDTTIEALGSNRTTFGDPQNALGASTGDPGDIVSLGDSGIAILTFEQPIINGPSFDFAVFENSFSDDYLEFAHVEVSSDGINYVRFPSHSEVQSDVQIHGFGLTDTRRIYNLAGKYRGGYGTPFDLDEIKDSIDIDVNKITHVKIIDVIGSVGESGTFDSFGNKINEPFSTPYESGGFDLEAVGVINEWVNTIDYESNTLEFTVYPNPSDGLIKIKTSNVQSCKIVITNSMGQIIFQNNYNNQKIINNVPQLNSGFYTVILSNKFTQKQQFITVK
ncbi:MAG: secretion protein [Fluviicola sp.]|nr:MAG: secretion protein [Fluviicola sp.]